MSLVFITDHNEVIYDAVPSRQKIISKPPQYPNYLHIAIDDNKVISKNKYGTMGPAEYFPPNPQDFLKKNSRKTTHKDKSKKFERYCTKHEKRPSVPIRDNYKPQESNINFIRENVKNMIKSKPRHPKENVVLTNYGDKVPANFLEPKYVHSKNFGKYPRYLLQHQHHQRNLLQLIKDEKEMNQISNCRYITRIERQALLNGLKQNWDEKQKEFQLLPMITDTIPKRNRKLQIENELRSLEKDILLIEKHPYLYIIDEEKSDVNLNKTCIKKYSRLFFYECHLQFCSCAHY